MPTTTITVSPGDTLADDPTFPAGYDAFPDTPWRNGQKLDMGTRSLWWNGSGWMLGAAPDVDDHSSVGPAGVDSYDPANYRVRAEPIDFKHDNFVDRYQAPWLTQNYDEFDFVLEDTTGVLAPLWLAVENGYCVTDYDLGYPTPREVMYDRPLADGQFDMTRFVGSRNISLTITLLGEQVGVSNAELRTRLGGFLHPKRRPILSFVEHEWPIRRRAVVRGKAIRATIQQEDNNVVQVNFNSDVPFIEAYEPTVVVVPMSERRRGQRGHHRQRRRRGRSLGVRHAGRRPVHDPVQHLVRVWAGTQTGRSTHPADARRTER